MKIDLFIKSYPKDYPWLKYCLQSIEKFVTGYNEIHVVIPSGTIQGLVDAKVFIPHNTHVHPIEEKGIGYIHQQYVKLIAHKYSEADYILYLDSDCLFTHPVDVRTLIVDGKPTILHTPYKDIETPWQKSTEKVFDREIEFEFMRRNFLIYHRRTLEKFQEWFEKRFVCSLLDYFMSVNEISEFNLLGAYAWFYEDYKYNWIDTRTGNFPPETGKQFWSHSNITDKEEEEIKKILA